MTDQRDPLEDGLGAAVGNPGHDCRGFEEVQSFGNLGEREQPVGHRSEGDEITPLVIE